MVGASWLIMKTDGLLQKKAVRLTKLALIGTVIGMILVSITTPLMSERIFSTWFTLPNFYYLLPIPVITGCLILFVYYKLGNLPMAKDKGAWIPFVCSVLLFIMGFLGLAISFFPYIVPDKITIWQAASSHNALVLILWGVVIVLPFILGYTCYVYRIFFGKVNHTDVHH